MEEFILKYWAQLSLLFAYTFALGKLWHMVDTQCETLRAHSRQLKELFEKAESHVKSQECEANMAACKGQIVCQINALAALLQRMDDKREQSRNEIQAILSEIASRIGSLEGKMEALHEANRRV